MLAHGSIHSHKVQVLSREPRIQLFREFANPDIVRTALLDLDGASAGGPTLDAGGYDPTNRFGLRALKTLVVNATYYPSVISSPWKVGSHGARHALARSLARSLTRSLARPLAPKVYHIGGDAGDGTAGDDFFERYPFMDNIYETRRNIKLVGDVKMTMLITLQAPEEGGETYFPLEGITDEVGHADARLPIPKASRQSLQQVRHAAPHLFPPPSFPPCRRPSLARPPTRPRARARAHRRCTRSATTAATSKRASPSRRAPATRCCCTGATRTTTST